MRPSRILLLFVAVLLQTVCSFAQSTELVPFQDANGKWGYKNAQGNVVIQPKYKYASYFSEGLAPAAKNNLFGKTVWGFIDTTGKWVIKPEYDQVGSFNHGQAFASTLVSIEKNGFIDKRGESTIKIGRGDLILAKYLGNDDYEIKNNKNEAFSITKQGKSLIYKRIPISISDKDCKLYVQNKGENGIIVYRIKNDERVSSDELMVIVGNDTIKKRTNNISIKDLRLDFAGERLVISAHVTSDCQFSQYSVFLNDNLIINKYAPTSYYEFADLNRTEERSIGGVFITIPSTHDRVVANSIWNGSEGIIKDETNKYHLYLSKSLNIDLDSLAEGDNSVVLSFYGQNGQATWSGEKIISCMKHDENKQMNLIHHSTDNHFKMNMGIYSSYPIKYCNVYLNNEIYDKYEILNDESLQMHYLTFDRDMALIYGNNIVQFEIGDNIGRHLLEMYVHYRNIEEPVKNHPRIELSNIPSTTTEPLFVLNTEVKSESKIEYCKVYLNGVEVQEDNATGGSSIVEDQKGDENHDITINRTLVLREGKNTIGIKVKNAVGETAEERTLEYKPAKTNQEQAIIVWNDIPATTTESRLELDATVKSKVKKFACRVLLNDVELAAPTKGSSIVEDSDEHDYKYKMKVQRTLTLKENATNTIVIEVKDDQGKLLKSDQKQVTYTKPALATIEWGSMPSTTDEKQFTLRAQISSESKIEHCGVIINGERTKGSNIVKDAYNVTINELLNLREGKNTVKIEVRNKAGEVSAERTITYTAKEKRIALVIGNKIYNNNPYFPSLRNPVNDATALENKLKGFGFTVLHVHNGTKEMMNKEIDVFIREAATSDMALFYYSGHGMQLKSKGNDNYMVPVSPPQYVEDIDDACISANDLVKRLRAVNCQAGIIVLDACRVEPNLPSKDNPNAPRGTGGIKGLSSMSPQGFITVFAAADNCEAYDGIGNNSPFMESMLECFDNYSQLPIESFLKKVRELTYEKSDKRQWPYVYEGLRGDFYFKNNNK